MFFRHRDGYAGCICVHVQGFVGSVVRVFLGDIKTRGRPIVLRLRLGVIRIRGVGHAQDVIAVGNEVEGESGVFVGEGCICELGLVVGIQQADRAGVHDMAVMRGGNVAAHLA